MDREILGSTEHFGNKFVIFRAKTFNVNRRFKTSSLHMSPILRGTPSLQVRGIPFAVFVLCCTVHAVPNDREEKRNGGNDEGGNEQYYSSFQAHIYKQAFVSVSNLPNKIYLYL